jgi:ferredoxin
VAAPGSFADGYHGKVVPLADGRKVIAVERCLGCGVCVAKCTHNAIELRRDPARGTPLEIEQLVETAARSSA